MDEKELQEQEFSLEDIIREFHEETEQEAEPTAEQETPEAETVAEPPQPPVTGDTIRLEKIPETPGTVRNAQLITDEEPESFVPPAPEQTTEPYSEQWEPDYEQPIAEYIPPQPISFRPRSRLRELKRQLVAGPEKQYYALMEKGLGKLQMAILLCLLLVLVSAALTVLYATGVMADNRLRFMVFVQFWVMLVAALLGSFQLIQGAVDLVRKRFSMNTLLLFTFLLCCVDGVLCLGQLRIPCCAAFSLQVLMSLWSEYHRRNTKLGQLDTMRKATRLDSITAYGDYCQGLKGFLRGEGQVEPFMQTYETQPRLNKVLSVYTLVALCVSVAVGIAAAILRGVSTGIQVAAVTCLAAMPASMLITLSRPMAVLEKRLHSLGALLCGWQGAEGLAGKAVFPIEHNDLFPFGSVQLNGVKFFGSRQPDTIIAYAAALMEADGNSLEPMFTQLLDSRNGRHYPVQNFRSYEGGIGGQVCGEPVLAGSLSFLKDMGVDLPEGIRVSHAVCLAVDGELCGLFALNYEKDRTAAAGLSALTGSRGLKPVLTAADFMLTPEFVREIFGTNPKKIIFPEQQERLELQEKNQQPEAQALAMVTQEGLASVAYAVTGARTLLSSAKAGVAVHMAGGILGIAMMLVLVLIGATHLLTPANMFLYELLWLIPGFLITEWPRSI